MKNFFLASLKVLGSILGLLLFYVLVGAVLSWMTVPEESNQPDQMTVYLKSNGVHTDIVMPVKTAIKDWRQDVRYSDTRGKDTTAQWVGIGWGDKGFYLETPTWADLKASTAIKAATGFNSTAMHATFYSTVTPGPDCKKVQVSKDQYARLVDYVEDSFERNASGQSIPIPTNAVYSKDDAFYEAKGRYSIFKSCNTWVNTGLKQSGMKACVWTPLDFPILTKYP